MARTNDPLYECAWLPGLSLPEPRARAFAAKLKEAHALLEAERIEAFSTADQEPPADSAAFQNPLGTDGGEDADDKAAEDENSLSKT